MSSRGVFCDTGRHSCEGRNPDNSVLSKLDARLRGMTNKTPRPFIQLVSTSSAVSLAYNIGKVSFSIKLSALSASGGAEPFNHGPLNSEPSNAYYLFIFSYP
jgi:hypothetical protein